MKKLIFFLLLGASLFIFSTTGFATTTTFDWGHVASVQFDYEDPSLNAHGLQEFYRMYASSGVDDNTADIYLTGGPLTNHKLNYWGAVWAPFHEYGYNFNPWEPYNFDPPGVDWEGSYTFWADLDNDGLQEAGDPTWNWFIPNDGLRKIEAPTNLTILGNQMSWGNVEYANQYRVRAFQVDSNGYIDYYALVYDGIVANPSGETTTFDLTALYAELFALSLGFDDIALVINSREYLTTTGYVNSSRYFFRPGDHVVPEPKTFLLFGLSLLGFTGITRRRNK